MAAPVSGQEHRLGSVDAAEAQDIGRLAPWRRHRLFPDVLQAGQVIDAGSADNAEKRFGHGYDSFGRKLAQAALLGKFFRRVVRGKKKPDAEASGRTAVRVQFFPRVTEW